MVLGSLRAGKGWRGRAESRFADTVEEEGTDGDGAYRPSRVGDRPLVGRCCGPGLRPGALSATRGQGAGEIYLIMTDPHCCMAETNLTL